MKKVFALAWALCGMLTFSGCVMEDQLSTLLDETLPVGEQWESFTFQPLTATQPLVVTRVSQDKADKLAISTSDYEQDYLAVAVYKKDCPACQQQAPWFDKLAKDFPPDMFGMDFIAIFLDLDEDSSDKNVPWLNALSNVQAYANAATVCAGGACQQVFIPSFVPLKAGTVYYVNKKDVLKTRKGLTWDSTRSAEDQYETLRAQVADVLDLQPITFDPSVNPWKDVEQDTDL